MRKVKENVFAVGAIDWDRRLFDELIPLPDGTSYNAFIVKGSEKTALIDTVDPEMTPTLIKNIIQADIEKIDYIICHHGEQDHSGSAAEILRLYPDAKIVTNAKCKAMLIDLLCIAEDKFEVIADGDSLSLGDKMLEFVFTPWVHWPETFCSWLVEDKILFSCDFFGSHIASSDLFVKNEDKIYESAKRYFAEIMMPFRTAIRGNIEKISKFDIEIIAPSHGSLYDKPSFIIDAYKEWISDKVKNEVVIAFASMHGSTRAMTDYLVDALIDRGVTVKRFDLVVSDLGEIAASLVDAATVVIGTSTVLAGAHPAAASAAFVVNALRPKTKFVSIYGSYGWGGKTVEQLSGLLGNLKAEIIEPVLVKGHPKGKDLKALDEMAEAIVAKHRELGILK
ncbi:MAG: FprA family A-type flavoprotein [Anaerohalosphaeraceae bacterium]|nr:FprA family A-type flavoprotein [Anaerohalosphaeraceae bacterium]